MNSNSLPVPKGVRYISEWEDFSLKDYPHIIDKQIPGCGFTQWCLTNNMNVILCSPRKVLLENKKDQLGENVFLVKSFYFELGVDKDTSSKRLSPVDPKKVKEKLEIAKEKAKKNFELIRNDLINFWLMCQSKKTPCKILVTYDSYQKVKDVFKELGVFNDFYTIVDEFQSIFIDSRFKSDTELEFVNTLQDVQKVCYVSATPMIEEYLDEIDEFKNLPYTVLDWKSEEPGRIMKPNLTTFLLRSVKSVGGKIIDSYKSGNFAKSAVKIDGISKIIESKEAVIYVNSVNNIINLISWNNLQPEEVNILCADTEDNQKRIQAKLGKQYVIGKVPTKEEPRKMFTFCTRTVYLGADFYSDNARTFVLSDANVDSMAIDITLDLPQILGRQRLDINPWKNKAELYVKLIAKKNKVAINEFKKLINKKLEATESLLRSYDRALEKDKHKLAETYEVVAMTLKYRKDYVAVNARAGSDLKPVTNNLAYVSEKRAYEIQQIDYADRFSVINRVESVLNKVEADELNNEVENFMKVYNSILEPSEKMQYLCTAKVSSVAITQILERVAEYHKKFFIFLGPERCKALGYNYSRMEKECLIRTFDVSAIKDFVYSEFKVGDRISLAEIKEKLKNGYIKLSYSKTAKANDIEEWFEVKDCQVLVNEKRSRGYELLRKKF